MRKFTFILALVMSMLSFTNAKADKLSIGYAESSIYAYQTYSVENAFDGSFSTKFWSNGNPQAGYTFTVYLKSSANVGDIKLYFAVGDLPADGAVIEVNDNGTWVQVGEPLNGVQANDVVTRNAGGVYTKQIRLRFTQASAFWFQLLEFEVYESEVSIPERTISAVAGEGGAVSINGGSEAVTGTEAVQLTATPDYGYKFVNWTVEGVEVSTSAEYADNTDGNKEYVANFAKFASVDEWYADIDKPTFNSAGGTHIISAVEFNGENLSDFNYTLGATSSFQSETFTVAPGQKYSLSLTYELHWGDIALYQIDRNGTEKKYGYYTCQWESYGDPYVILGRNADLMCQEFGIEDFATLENFKSGETTYIKLPYEITVSENHKPGDLIVVRAMIDKGANGAYGQGIEEGGCLDILFQVAEVETGIDEVKDENGNVKTIFDLTGRRVESISAPGIYIVNGKKLLVK